MIQCNHLVRFGHSVKEPPYSKIPRQNVTLNKPTGSPPYWATCSPSYKKVFIHFTSCGFGIRHMHSQITIQKNLQFSNVLHVYIVLVAYVAFIVVEVCLNYLMSMSASSVSRFIQLPLFCREGEVSRASQDQQEIQGHL